MSTKERFPHKYIDKIIKNGKIRYIYERIKTANAEQKARRAASKKIEEFNKKNGNAGENSVGKKLIRAAKLIPTTLKIQRDKAFKKKQERVTKRHEANIARMNRINSGKGTLVDKLIGSINKKRYGVKKTIRDAIYGKDRMRLKAEVNKAKSNYEAASQLREKAYKGKLLGSKIGAKKRDTSSSASNYHVNENRARMAYEKALKKYGDYVDTTLYGKLKKTKKAVSDGRKKISSAIAKIKGVPKKAISSVRKYVTNLSKDRLYVTDVKGKKGKYPLTTNYSRAISSLYPGKKESKPTADKRYVKGKYVTEDGRITTKKYSDKRDPKTGKKIKNKPYVWKRGSAR